MPPEVPAPGFGRVLQAATLTEMDGLRVVPGLYRSQGGGLGHLTTTSGGEKAVLLTVVFRSEDHGVQTARIRRGDDAYTLVDTEGK